MAELRTDAGLLKALQSAATKTPSADELREQRISFILGSLGKESGITREKVVRVLDDQQGKKSA